MLLPGVSHNIDQFAAISQIAQLVERKKRCTRKIRFHAQHSIELNRMPYGLVNLQSQLRSVEDNCGRSFRALLRVMQRDRFFRHATGTLH